MPASLGAADANGRPHAASIKVDATVTGMVKAFIRIGSIPPSVQRVRAQFVLGGFYSYRTPCDALDGTGAR